MKITITETPLYFCTKPVIESLRIGSTAREREKKISFSSTGIASLLINLFLFNNNFFLHSTNLALVKKMHCLTFSDVCVYGLSGDSPPRPKFRVLARHHTKRAEAAVCAVCRVFGLLHMSHHNRGLLQTEWVLQFRWWSETTQRNTWTSQKSVGALFLFYYVIQRPNERI